MRMRALSWLTGVVLLPAVAVAQTNFAGMTYNFSFPAVDTDAYVGQDSWYGATLDLKRRMTNNENMLMGLSTGWYVFYDNRSDVIEFESGAISGEQYRNFNFVPILVNTSYHFGQRGQPRPYVGLHAGAYYVWQVLDIGLYRYTESNWHFGLAPEAGVTFPVRVDGQFYFNARYHYLFEAGEYLGGDSLTLPFLTLGVGFAWTY